MRKTRKDGVFRRGGSGAFRGRHFDGKGWILAVGAGAVGMGGWGPWAARPRGEGKAGGSGRRKRPLPTHPSPRPYGKTEKEETAKKGKNTYGIYHCCSYPFCQRR